MQTPAPAGWAALFAGLAGTRCNSNLRNIAVRLPLLPTVNTSVGCYVADADLASVAAAAPQLTHLERLDLQNVKVCYGHQDLHEVPCSQ